MVYLATYNTVNGFVPCNNYPEIRNLPITRRNAEFETAATTVIMRFLSGRERMDNASITSISNHASVSIKIIIL